MNKKVTITIDVDMDSPQSQEWHKPEDFLRESVKAALWKICDDGIKNGSGYVDFEAEKADYTVHVQSGASARNDG